MLNIGQWSRRRRIKITGSWKKKFGKLWDSGRKPITAHNVHGVSLPPASLLAGRCMPLAYEQGVVCENANI